ncbi:MAG: transglutaminase family protein [bacterium]
MEEARGPQHPLPGVPGSREARPQRLAHLVERPRALPHVLQGVGMPGHFIVMHAGPGEPVYLEPFGGGRILGEADCAAVVKEMGYHFDRRFLRETPARRILERMLNNLIGIFRREGDEERSRQLLRYREIVQSG